MKRIYLLLAGFLLPLVYALNLLPQPECIKINDRKLLPEGIYQLLKNYRVVLIGEMHGTNEAPEFVNGTVNLWLNSGEKILLGLEITKNTQSKIDSFMSTGDFTPVKKSLFFNNAFKSGTSSIAMAELIKSFYNKSNVKIICLCNDKYYSNTNWDSTMAINIIHALKADSGWKMIALTGNVHNKMDSGRFGKPMGYWLYKIPNIKLTKEEIASVDVVYDSGTAWNCTPDCGVHQQEIEGNWYQICNYNNYFSSSEYGKMFFYTKNVTASLPLNP